ncbi:MAG: lipoate--protein ligase family protein [Candidatus Omnitrophica bacterium]|nr:lipoate--protein ligase family protein [Candidatus Omnitrophota bacterium]
MTFKDISFHDPSKNLDYDDELLRQADKGTGEEVLRFWESPLYFIVLGRTSSVETDVNEPAALSDGIPILRRSSGGGTVLQGPGCLNFSLVLSKIRRPELESIQNSYKCILELILKRMEELQVQGDFRPVSDLVLKSSEKKFSGNAQRRGRTYILHHGTILYNFNLELISRYLKMPPKQPEYRRGRTHHDFVTNIPAAASGLKAVITKAFID